MTYINAHMCLVTQLWNFKIFFYTFDVCWLFHSKKIIHQLINFQEKFEQLTYASDDLNICPLDAPNTNQAGKIWPWQSIKEIDSKKTLAYLLEID